MKPFLGVETWLKHVPCDKEQQSVTQPFLRGNQYSTPNAIFSGTFHNESGIQPVRPSDPEVTMPMSAVVGILKAGAVLVKLWCWRCQERPSAPTIRSTCINASDFPLVKMKSLLRSCLLYDSLLYRWCGCDSFSNCRDPM